MKLALSPQELPPIERGVEDDAAPCVLSCEDHFYHQYDWCLNLCLTVRETIARLAGEMARLDSVPQGWQRREVMTNVYLLTSALLNSADDYALGPVYLLPRGAGMIPGAKLAIRAVTKVHGWLRALRVRRAVAWRRQADAALRPLLRHYIAASSSHDTIPSGISHALAEVLRAPLPRDLQDEVINIPSAFRKLDLTALDVLALGRDFIAQFPDRRQPILAVGLRTAGTYFAPLFRALLDNEGYQNVETLTLRPDTGIASREQAALRKFAKDGLQAVLLDDPPVTGGTFADAAEALRRLGFPAERIVCLFPESLSHRNGSIRDSIALAHLRTVTLKPEEWHKRQLLNPAAVEDRLTEYACRQGFVRARVITDSPSANDFNRQLEDLSEDVRRTRLKRVFEVSLEAEQGTVETRFILAKSVGWGYLAYHAFLAGHKLAGHVPPLWGLRDGLLFTEWLPQEETEPTDGSHWIEAVAEYTANRVRMLPLPNSDLGSHKYNHGLELLHKVLCKAFGNRVLAKLMRHRVRRRLAELPCPVPTLIDGKMRPAEWLIREGELLKTDFDHHGMGKNELNVTDPCYDLADAILQLSLSTDEQRRLLDHYRTVSGDSTVDSRLFTYKLLAGLWTMAGAIRNLEQASLAHRQQEFHCDYWRAWDFLTEQTARHCGRLCQPSASPSWRSPLVILDVDGVIDRRIFGFPCTTAAGIEALALLHGHGYPVALNTARSVAEVRAYCEAYGCAGAVAEYGSYLWDAVNQRGRVLLSEEVLRQLDRAREALARLPGVFLHPAYEYSIRACTYENGGPVPLPLPLIQRVLAAKGPEQLALHQTSIDSTISARDSDKGTGLSALLDWVGLANAETIAVGDSDPDLAMFRVAMRSFAPSHIGCSRMARILGCKIAPHPFQRGLLHIVRSIVHPDGGRCERCAAGVNFGQPGNDLFLDLLRAADQKPSRLLLRALFHPDTFKLFIR